MLLGVFWILVAWMNLPETILLGLLLGASLLLVTVVSVYSYIEWKNDPARRTT